MTGTFTSTYQYVREFGLSEVETWSDFLYMKDSLRGAVINGIVYGDTALVVSVNDDNEYLAKEFKLYQNYPNPFNPTTKIKYTIPTVERNAVSLKKNKRFGKSHYNVSLRVYSILGEEITTLVNEAKQPGTYEVEFDAAKLPSGVYFYRLNAGDYSETKKMILIR
ncbi:MAG: T9SS type A sorting domain-containing protein [Melioribacteraceae bacterium]|nr:T9SS type A sorting domain-containing protein [Melioribacteraceae bacterium]MCF8356741.1 T9SS type A sorting domain-containing protein [Melioribacteraceae bacterium]MCF8395964.1 T9SS type A sorting domain-containing protein [Melioribacteraceae bacterium]MCF8419527.1 T9SS type A sorting domain-containing protein [Melioribacteraceae bacterium]